MTPNTYPKEAQLSFEMEGSPAEVPINDTPSPAPSQPQEVKVVSDARELGGTAAAHKGNVIFGVEPPDYADRYDSFRR